MHKEESNIIFHLKKYLKEKNANNDLIEILENLDEGFILILNTLVNELSPSANSLNSLIQIILEIQKRDKIQIDKLLQLVDINSILNSKGARKDKFSQIRDKFAEIRFPEKTSIEKKIYTLVSDIKKEFNVRLELPKDLEGDSINLAISFREPKSLSEISNRLKLLSNSQNLEELFSILKGET